MRYTDEFEGNVTGELLFNFWALDKGVVDDSHGSDLLSETKREM
jgi:hypothetical protein